MKARRICYGEGCGTFLGWIDTSDGRDSHGLCLVCYKTEIQKADDAFRWDEHQQKEE